MSSSDESDSTIAVRQFIAACLGEHQAMQCYVRQEELLVLPISLSDDKVVVVPIDAGHWEVARRKTLKLKSIVEPRLHKMQVRAEDLDRIRLAIKHSYPIQITYFDESGKEIEAEVDSALREEGDFLVSERVHIRIQWISQASFSLPDDKNEVQRRKLPTLVDELVGSEQESVKALILGGVGITHLVPNAGLKGENPPKMPEIREFAVEMTPGGRESEFCDGIFSPRPPSLESRTERGFPHSHSDGCC